MFSLASSLSLLMFAVAMTGTPGPNNVMLTASGALYGYRRTLPHIVGILGGCFVLFTLIGLGLGAVFQRFPLVQLTLRVAGTLYLLYLAWRIARAPAPDFEGVTDSTPLSIWQAAAFQFLNPKAWVMGLTLTASFMPGHGPLLLNAALLALVMEIVAFPCISFWAGFGMAIARWLRTSAAWRRFNGVMGALTAACVVFIYI